MPPVVSEDDGGHDVQPVAARVDVDGVEGLEGQVLDSPEVALQMSRAQFQKGDARAALSTLEPFASVLLEGRADSRLSEMLAADLLVEHGRLLIAVGRQEDAVLGLDRATELVPEDRRVWQVLGQALAEAGRREEARQAVERFIRIVDAEMPVGPRESRSIAAEDDPTAKQLREAMRLLGKDRAEEALALVRQEAELVPEDPRPRIVESRALLMLRRPEAALAAAEQAIAIAPSHPDGYYQRGVVRMTLEDDAAEADFRHALEILPTHTPAMDDLAVWLMKEGRNREARQLLERALQLNPNDAVARRNLARLDQISAGYGFSIGRDP